MNQTLEQRMQSIEDELKEIRKELEESLARYKQGRHLFTDYDWPTPYPKGLEIKCLWDSIPVEDRMKPMGLSCPCMKCSAYC